MSQVSYGTITITDTNDIESITVEYARNQDPATAPDTGWNTTRPDWEQGYYIWQRTRIHKSGTEAYEDTFGAAVCLTGSTGQTGAAGRSLIGTVTKYTNVAANSTQAQVEALAESAWLNNVPAYNSNKPEYWVRVTNTYDKAPLTENIYYKDQGLTDAIATANQANATANAANQTANAALNNTQAKYATSSTSAASTAKIATFSPTVTGWSLFSGAEIFVRFTNKNTITSPTLNVNQTGAKPIKDSDGNDLAEKFYWKDNSLVHFVYDGTNWRILDIVTAEKYNTLVSDIDGISQTVGTKASQTDLTNLTTRVSTNETNISQTATSITSLVSNQDTYTAPDGTTKTNTIKSAIKQNADNISLRVEKNGVIAAINASTESSGGSAIKISADKVNIEGAAIFTGNGRLSQTSLNNAYDSKGSAATAESNAIATAAADATSKANAAQAAAEANAATDATSKADAVNSALEAYKTTTNSTLTNLQNQVDGQVEVWYYNVDPTTSNPPASSWNTDALKARHEGDLYYNIDNGHSWRWLKNGSTYSWQQIPDGDAAAALAKATEALGVANNKRRIFTAQPTTPYEVGDLWVNGSEVKYCKTSRASGNYTATDWALTATDDTKANSAAFEEQYIYISKVSGTTSVSKNETWVTRSDDVQNTWTTKRPTYSSGYPVLFIAKQKKTVSQSSGTTCSCSTPVKDDTTTVIDGGHITTGTIDAARLNVNDIIASGSIVVNSDISDMATKTYVGNQGYQTQADVEDIIGDTNVSALNDGSDYTKTANLGNTTAVQNAAKTASNYLGDIDSNAGVTLKAKNGTTTDSTSTSNYIKINSSGLEVYKAGISIAQYGDIARIGKTSSSRFLINATSLQAYNSSNKLYFEVSSSGIKYGTDLSSTSTTTTVASTTYADNQASAAEANASYSVEIEVSSIDFVNNNATLVAHPYFKGVKLTNSTTPTLSTITGYSWSRADGTAIPSGVTTNAKTLQLPNNSDLNATYVCTISKA